MSMRDYEEMKDIVIPKEQEEMMNIICDAWEECRTLNNCKECPDRPKEFMRMMMCTSLRYTRKLIEAGYVNNHTVLADFDKKYVNNNTILADFDKKREVLK